ncbi:TPA: phage terminase small subunit P27 family [Clostridioides difficile]|nr:phage terminase small subunit P27 family [Clostridioides difficile]
MGRKKQMTSTTKKHLTKKEKQTRRNVEKQIKLDRDDLVTVPEPLNSDILAYKEFSRVVEEAGKIDLWDNLDLPMILLYSDAYSNYIKLKEYIEKTGHVVSGKDTEKISPYVTAKFKYAELILKCSAKLGLATTDRLKLVVPENENSKENKFAKFIKVGT